MDAKNRQMSDRYKSIILVAVIAAAFGIYMLFQLKGPSHNPYKQPIVVASRPAPDFTLSRLNDEMTRLSDYRGKVVFLNIWATWCAPCREEMPAMEKLYQELKEEAFEILAVSIDVSGAKAVAPFMQEYKLSFPALLDPKGIVKRLYSLTGIPETYIIDKNGIIVSKIIGPRDWAGPEAIRFFRSLAQKPIGDG